LNNKRKKNYYYLFIPVFALICFSAALKNGFTNWDDQEYVLNNTAIHSLSPSAISYLFSHFLVISYHPLTLLSLAINYAISGTSATGYIVTNILLHLFNSWLVYRLILNLFKEQNFSLFISALFAVHPLMTEPVLWIAGRKDVLYTLFFLSSLLWYLKYIRSHERKAYAVSFILFICSCLSKAQGITLFLSLFAVDYLNEERFSLRIRNKIPFLLAAVSFGIISILAQGRNVIAFTGTNFSFVERVAMASENLLRYLFHVIYPFRLSAFYPYPQTFEKITFVFIPVTLLAFSLLIYYFRKDKPAVFGIIFFLLNIIMVLQIFPVGDAAMADRYLYIPAIGVFILIAQILTRIKNYLKMNPAVTGFLTVVIVLISGSQTILRAKVWKNGFTLWTDVMRKYPTADIAFVNRGSNYFAQGDTSLALKDYLDAIKINNRNQFARNNAGSIYFSRGDFRKAIDVLNMLDTSHTLYKDELLLRAYSKNKLGDYLGSLTDVNSYLLKSNSAEANTLGGLNEILLNDFNQAKEYLHNAIMIDPAYMDAYVKIGVAQIQTGDTASSCISWKKAAAMGNTDVIPYLQQYCKN
jgi:Tfp pilus assembly protein PilF